MNVESIVPNVLHREVGVNKWEKNLPPRQMYEAVSRRGYHNVPGDKGGPTMCGVTWRTFADWRRRQGKPNPTLTELKKLTYDEWLEILKKMFWDPCQADKIENDSIAEMLVDWRWVNGGQAIRDAQTAFSLRQDGIVGPKTLAALNAKPASVVFERLKAARLASYRKIVARAPGQSKFYSGWVNRTNGIQFKE